MQEQEIWKDVVGYEGLYQVSNFGRIKSLPKLHNSTHPYVTKERILKFFPNKDGYWLVDLYKNKQKKHHQVHRLVAIAFIPNPMGKPEINHLNEVITDNRVENLEWATRTENNNYGNRNKKVSLSLKKYSTMYAQICRNNFSKKVEQYTLDGVLVKVWCSVSEVNRKLGFSQGNISSCCRGGDFQRYPRMHEGCFSGA